MRHATWIVLGSALALSACATPQATPSGGALVAAYEHSIRDSATRTPAFTVDLRTIPPDETRVPVANFTEWGAPQTPTARLVWVSVIDQLKALCRGAPDAVLAIQEILGLPPLAAPSRPDHTWQVFTFTVPRTSLFRPCVGGGDIGAPRCGEAMAPPPSAQTMRAASDDAAVNRFLLDQIWSSHRAGFHTTSGAEDWGYPFTGMGWTYDWDPKAASPVGASEFVIRIGTAITDAKPHTPTEFCASS